MIDPRPTIDRPDDDPWRWLEEIEGSRALDWVTAQTAATLSRYADAHFEADRDAVRAILDLPDNIPWITRITSGSSQAGVIAKKALPFDDFPR